MRERNGADAQARVELKTARWRARREIDELTATGPAPIPSPASPPARRPGPRHAGHRYMLPAGSSLRADGLITGIFSVMPQMRVPYKRGILTSLIMSSYSINANEPLA
jgi:hypothetical protein